MMMPLSTEKLSDGSPAMVQLRILTGSPSEFIRDILLEHGMSLLLHSSIHSSVWAWNAHTNRHGSTPSHEHRSKSNNLISQAHEFFLFLITNISHNRNNVLISVIYFSWRLVFVVKNTCVRGCEGSNNNVFWGRLFNAVPFEHHRKAYKLNIETIWRPLVFVTSKLLVLTEANCIKTHTGKHAHRHKHSLKCSLTCKLILCPCMYLF